MNIVKEEKKLEKICRTCNKNFKIKHVKTIFVNCKNCRDKQRSKKKKIKNCEVCKIKMILESKSGKRFCGECATKRTQKSLSKYLNKNKLFECKFDSNFILDLDDNIIYNPLIKRYIRNGTKLSKLISENIIIERTKLIEGQNKLINDSDKSYSFYRCRIEEYWEELLNTIEYKIYTEEYLFTQYQVDYTLMENLHKKYKINYKEKNVDKHNQFIMFL